MNKQKITNKGLFWLMQELQKRDIPLGSPKAKYFEKQFIKVQGL